MISPAERQQRQAAINFARGSVRLEGFVISEEAETIARRFVEGEMALAEYVEAILAISKIGPDSRKWDEGQITGARIAELHLNPVGRDQRS